MRSCCAKIVRMSDLERSLRLFLDLADQPSFSRVARMRNVSHTTIARAIDDLEVRLGTRLFRRTTRSLTLTADGESLLDHAGDVVDRIDQMEAALAGRAAVRGLVRVGVTHALGIHYAGRLGALNAAHPELVLDWLSADWNEVGNDPGLDLWIVVDPPHGRSDLVSLGLLPRMAVAAPAYLDAHGRPQAPSQLVGHQCLAHGYAARPAPWSFAGKPVVANGFLRANSSEAARRAAVGGAGIAVLPAILVADDIAAGRLEQVLAAQGPDPLSIGLAHGFGGIRMPARVRAVMNFMIGEFPGPDRAGKPAA